MTINLIIKVAEKHNVDVDIFYDYERKTAIIVIVQFNWFVWSKVRTKIKIQKELDQLKNITQKVLVVINEVKTPIID